MRFLLFLLLSSALNAAPFVWVSQNGGDELDVIDAETDTIIETIASADLDSPERIAILPNGKRAYVVNFNSADVTVFDTTSYEQIANIETNSSAEPFELAISPNGQWVYVPGQYEEVIYVISTATNTLTSTIDCSSLPGYPLAAAFSPDGSRVYVVDSDGFVTTINTGTEAIIRTDATGLSRGSCIAVAPNGRYAYIVDDNDSGNQAAKLDLQTYSAELFLVGGSNLSAVVFSHDGSVAYISDQGAIMGIGVFVIDTRDSTVLRTITSGSFSSPYGLALSQDGKVLYCADPGADLIFKIDTASASVTDEISNPGSPYYLATLPTSAHQRSFQRPSNRRAHN